jgi:hypothetical protein
MGNGASCGQTGKVDWKICAGPRNVSKIPLITEVVERSPIQVLTG